MFQFKQFAVEDDRSTMKVGTDAVLLGSTASCPGARRILDVGTGCGVIALMLAQQYPTAHIDAIDIDAPSVEQAAENFSRSPWPDRLHAIRSSLQDYESFPYDLIVSNPPYFTSSLKNPDPRRAQARHNDTLPLEDLLHHAARLLTPHGRLSLILPPKEAGQVSALWPPSSILEIHPRENRPPKRLILSLSKDNSSLITHHSSLILLAPDGTRTPAHRALTDAFYL